MAKAVVLLPFLLLPLLFCQSRNSARASGTRPDDFTVNNDVRAIGAAPRARRALVFPDPSTILLIFGLGTPLQLDRESVIVGLFTKMQYYLPTNSTDFMLPGVYYSRTGKSRWSIYKMLERVAELYGFGGKECLLRAICEATYAPFDAEHSLLGQLLQTFLKPSSTAEEYDEYGDREYRAAEQLAQRLPDGACHALYPECRRSLLDVFSTVAA